MNETKDKKLLAALVSSPTVRAAAEKVGITERRVNQRLSEPEFRQQYKNICSEMLQSATMDLQKLTGEAVQNLRDIASDADQPASARVQACKAVLEYSLKLTEETDLIDRIEALEQQKGGKQ